jgi:NTP pyrophosphatase (non-canonical NTP hydrolase)
MTTKDYQKNCMKTMNPKGFELLNVALGLCGESGEFADHIKKANFQGHDIDKAYLIKELGDIQYYIAIGCEKLGIDIEDIMVYNSAKLEKRYPNGFESERSVNRKE